MTTPNIPEAVVKAGGAVVNKIGWTCHDGTDEPGRYAECEECAETCDEVSRAVLTAAWSHLHPVVETVEKLDALSVGSIVRTVNGFSWEKGVSAAGGLRWYSYGCSPSEVLALPVIVLQRGDAL